MADMSENGTRREIRFTPKQVDSGDARTGIMRPSILFLGLALGLTAAIVGWLGLTDTNDDIRLEVTDVKIDSDGDTELSGALYRGRTESGKRFEIAADHARETANNPGQIDLEKPKAKIFSGDGGIVDITSLQGAYSKSGQKVDLAGDVVITDTSRQLTMETQKLRTDFANGNMDTNTSVRVTGRDGRVIADGMRVVNNGDLIIFNGNPKMTLHNGTVFE